MGGVKCRKPCKFWTLCLLCSGTWIWSAGGTGGGRAVLCRLTASPRLYRRFQALYKVNLHRNARAQLRRQGQGAAVFILYQLAKYSRPQGVGTEVAPGCIGWTLLVTDGECVARHREVLKDALNRESRLCIGPYQLGRRTRRGEVRPVLSYSMTSDHYEAWRTRVIMSARGDPADRPELVLRDLYLEPGFGGVRSQVGHICALYRREWRHRRRAGDAFPRLPRLGYVARLSSAAQTLDSLLDVRRRDLCLGTAAGLTDSQKATFAALC